MSHSQSSGRTRFLTPRVCKKFEKTEITEGRGFRVKAPRFSNFGDTVGLVFAAILNMLPVKTRSIFDLVLTGLKTRLD